MAAVISAIADYMLAHGRRHVAVAFSSDSNDWPRLPPERSAHRPDLNQGLQLDRPLAPGFASAPSCEIFILRKFPIQDLRQCGKVNS